MSGRVAAGIGTLLLRRKPGDRQGRPAHA